MNKTCTANCPCQYRITGPGSVVGYGCSYDNYCDYQLPRDSRMPCYTIPIADYSKCHCAGQIGNDGHCLVCGLLK